MTNHNDDITEELGTLDENTQIEDMINDQKI